MGSVAFYYAGCPEGAYRVLKRVDFFFLCLRLLEKRRHYVIGLSERVKECKSVNATGIPNGILSKADANPRLTEI